MKITFKIHFLYYLVALVAIINGFFKDYIYITLLIFIHEIGHIIPSIYYNWKIDKIVILPFGGITIFNELINRSLKEEFIILIMGPLFQEIFYLILCILNIENDLITKYHYALLVFNLLPIIPLDGSKLINIILNRISSFNKSYLLTIYISVITIFILLLNNRKNLMFLIILLFLILKIIKNIKNHKYIFNRFLLERYIYELKFKKIKKIKGKNLKKMKKDYRHIFYDKKYYTEKEVLKEHFIK